MSEFNIKQQNRNRFNSSKAKKQTAKFKQNEKLARNVFDKKSNASESSECSSTEWPIEKKSKNERRKVREQKINQQNADSNHIANDELVKRVTDRKHDNPAPSTSKSFETKHDHQNTAVNNPTTSSSRSQNANPQTNKVFTNNGQQKKQAKAPDQLPKMPKKETFKNKQTKNTIFEPPPPVPKILKTNFQWFNPSTKPNSHAVPKVHNSKQPATFTTADLRAPRSQAEMDAIDRYFCEPLSTEHSIDSDSSNKYDCSTNKHPNGSRRSKSSYQENKNKFPGHSSQQPATFTTANLSQGEMKTVERLFCEPLSTQHSIDSDLSNKHDCSTNKHPNGSWRSESSYQENKNKFADTKSQQPFRPSTHDKSKEDSLNDDSKSVQKYGKRTIKSHANRNYDLPDYDDANDDEGDNFDDLSGATFSVSSHFLMKEQKEWLQQSESCTNPFALNLKCLAAGLHTIPFHQRQSLPENIFTSDKITRMVSEANSKIQTYEEVQLEAEEEKKTGFFREVDDNILKDDFIGDFLTCGDSFSIENPNSKEEDERRSIGEPSKHTLKLELDDDDFDSPFVPCTTVAHPDDKKCYSKSKRKRNRKHKNPSNQEKTINGDSSGEERSKSVGQTLELGKDENCLHNLASGEESARSQKQKLKCKDDDIIFHFSTSPPTPKVHSGVEKMREQTARKQDGDQSQSPSQCTEKRSRFDAPVSTSPPSAKVAHNVMSEQISSNQEKQESPSRLSSLTESSGKASSVLDTNKSASLEVLKNRHVIEKLSIGKSPDIKFNFKPTSPPKTSDAFKDDGIIFHFSTSPPTPNVEKMREQTARQQDGDQSQSPSQCTEKRSRVRGSSAFNITESLSELLAEKSVPNTSSNKIDSLNMESPSRLSPLTESSGKASSVLDTNKTASLENNFEKLSFGSSPNFKFNFKPTITTSPTKTCDAFKTKNDPPLPSKTSDSFDLKTKNNSPFLSKTSGTFKTKIYTPSPPKANYTFETKPSTEITDSFEFKGNSSSMPSLQVTSTNKKTPTIDIVKKDSGSKPVRSNTKGASSLASESPSSSSVCNSRPVIDDDEMDILLGITPNRTFSSSEETDNESLQSGSKGNLQGTIDTHKPTTSMLDENLDDWLDSVLQS